MLEIAVGRDGDAIDLAAAAFLGSEQRLDLLLLSIRQLTAVAVEELDAVVVRRVVRRRDHRAEIEREERHRGSRQDPAEDRRSAGGDDAACERFLEVGAGRARVTADEHASAARPQRRRLPEALQERGRDLFADDAADAVRAEVDTRHAANPIRWRARFGGGSRRSASALRELRRFARLVQAGLLPLDDPGAGREEAGGLSGTRSSGSASTSARAIPWRTAPAWPLGPPPWTRTRMSYRPSSPATPSGA